MIMHRLSEKEGSLLRIKLMLIQNNEKSHTFVRRLNALLYDQSRHNSSECCLHGFTTAELLERHKPKCMGQLKRPTRTELPKEGKNKVKFKNHHKQMKAPFVVYTDFESLIRKIYGCIKESQATIKTEVHEPIIMKSNGQMHGPFMYRGKDMVHRFLVSLLNDEKLIRAELANKKPLVMMLDNWHRCNSMTKCHICNESLVKGEFDVYNPNTGEYHKSHKRCYYQARKGFMGPLRERQPKSPDSEDCIFCKVPLLVNNYREAVKDHCHITGKYWGDAHNAWKLELCLNPRTPIPVVFHNLQGYDGHLLMQAMAWVQGEISCIPNNTEKYISFSLGNLKFIDSLNFMMSSLDVLVKDSTPEEMKITKNLRRHQKEEAALEKKGFILTNTWTAFKGSPRKSSAPKKSSS